MRIAMLSPIAWRTPPRHYGPWERVVSLLTEGLVARGVDVTLFATADSETRGRLVGTAPRGYEEDRAVDPKVWGHLHIATLFERAEEFDLIHNHFDFPPLCWSRLTTTPVVTTIHGFSSPRILPVYRRYNGHVFYVAISNADRRPELDYIATIHHGIDVENFPFREAPGEYLLFFGRIHNDKGAREAIQIARAAGRPLLLAGIIQDRDYFEREVAPHLDERNVRFLGSAGPAERNRLLSEAYALLHPIQFEEPFGLSVVEAMACGTPVIAFRRGSMPEIIRDGETGFLVDSVEEAAARLPEVARLDRRACRRHVEAHFTVERMVSDYLAVYEKVHSLRRREDHRPWGHYVVLADERDHKVKRIVVKPGARLSLQRHRYRQEHWYIVQGRARVVRNDEILELGPGEAVDIPRRAWHRIQNPGPEDLVFIEVQTGESFAEDDIERKEDDYGRVGG